MPNWVGNRVEISGPQEQLDKLAEQLQNPELGEDMAFSFNKILPIPAESAEDWYSWNITNWGVKWDTRDVETNHEPGQLAYRFNTAWSPPVPVLNALSHQNPDLVVNHVYEEEQGWGGRIEYRNGNGEQLESWDIPDSHAEMVKRNGACWCDEEHRIYSDCFSALAAEREELTEQARHAAVVLGAAWDGTFEELLNAAKSL